MVSTSLRRLVTLFLRVATTWKLIGDYKPSHINPFELDRTGTVAAPGWGCMMPDPVSKLSEPHLHELYSQIVGPI